MAHQIAIIGAGMAGLAAAADLRAAGHVCTVFDKSRGTGGRLATRRSGGLSFDHGAQYVTARGARFVQVVRDGLASGRMASWFEDVYVGTPGMSATVKGLAEGVDTQLGVQVTRLERMKDGWVLHGAAGVYRSSDGRAFSHVLLAIPAPQAASLLATSGLYLEGVDEALYAPCWALMFAWDGSCGFEGAFRRFEAGAPLGVIARNGSKPGRPLEPETFVVHASAEWSRDHLEEAPEDVLRLLEGPVIEQVRPQGDLLHAAAHRWRYALVSRPLDRPCLWNGDLNLGACGDWCIAPRVEAAFDSGVSLAAAVLAG